MHVGGCCFWLICFRCHGIAGNTRIKIRGIHFMGGLHSIERPALLLVLDRPCFRARRGHSAYHCVTRH